MKQLETFRGVGLGMAATLLLLFVGLWVPIVGLFVLPLVIFPALFVGVRVGKHAGQLLPLMATACVYVLVGLEVATLCLVFVLVTFFLFGSFGRGWSIATVVSGSAAGTLAAILVSAWVWSGSFSTLWAMLHAGVHAQVRVTLEMYERMGLPSETIEFLGEHAGHMATFFVQMLPGIIFLGVGVMVLVNLALLSWQFPQYRAFFFESEDLKEWKSPDHMVWFMLVPSLALFLPLGWLLRTVVVNVVFVCAVFYFFHGLAIVSYYFDHKNVPVFFRILGYMLIVFEQFLTVLVVGLGFFDLWGDFRRLKRRTAGLT